MGYYGRKKPHKSAEFAYNHDEGCHKSLKLRANPDRRVDLFGIY
jgi:hypothetical protein